MSEFGTMPPSPVSPPDLREWIGGVDIQLVDHILRGTFPSGGIRVLDAGCGGGRNLLWFLRTGCDVSAVDTSPMAVAQVRSAAEMLAPYLPPENFHVEAVEEMSFPDASFDVVLSIAVLHFARDEAQFLGMLEEMWRVLRRGGVLFVRVASTIGIEKLVVPLGSPRRYQVPDGSERFLVDLELLLRLTEGLKGELLDPIKTVNVQNQRCMTTWVLRKR